MNSSETTYSYADGSGNRYLITNSSLEYIPVTPGQSSTGTYSGGVSGKRDLTGQEFKTIQKMLDSAMTNPSIQIPDRMKTSGLISKSTSSGVTSVVLRPECAELVQIEDLLHRLLPTGR